MTADRPRLAYETEALAAVAAHLHAQRVSLYPAQVEKGRLTEAEAGDGIRIMAAIADDWRRRVAMLPAPAEPIATNAEKIATLEKAAARAAQLVERQLPADRDDYAECGAALLWWQQPIVPRAEVSRLDHLIHLNLLARANAAAPQAIAA